MIRTEAWALGLDVLDLADGWNNSTYQINPRGWDCHNLSSVSLWHTYQLTNVKIKFLKMNQSSCIKKKQLLHNFVNLLNTAELLSVNFMAYELYPQNKGVGLES